MGTWWKVALLVLEYARPAAFKDSDQVAWTTAIQTEEEFNAEPNNFNKPRDAGNIQNISSNVIKHANENRLKFAMNWKGENNKEEGYVEYILDISNVTFVE